MLWDCWEHYAPKLQCQSTFQVGTQLWNSCKQHTKTIWSMKYKVLICSLELGHSFRLLVRGETISNWLVSSLQGAEKSDARNEDNTTK